MIKEPLKKKRSFTSDQERDKGAPHIPTDGLVTFTSSSLSHRNIPNEVSEGTGPVQAHS